MNLSTTIPTTVQIGRGRLLGLAAGVAAAAAGISWAVSTYAVDAGTRPAAVASSSVGASSASETAIPALSLEERRWVERVTALTPEQLAAAAASAGFGTGNVPTASVGSGALDLPIPVTGYLDAIKAPRAPTRAEVLASLTPVERRHVKAVMALTPEQLAAGAASAGFGTGR
jgi:hypothetical protein